MSSAEWLETHHLAKISQRRSYVKEILDQRHPKRIVDLGCGTGLWLDLISHYVDENCLLVGIDKDPESLQRSRDRAKLWKQPHKFIQQDLLDSEMDLPSADIYLAFNILSYVNPCTHLLKRMRHLLANKATMFVRQYDGDLLRFGPMPEGLRNSVNQSLYSGVSTSQQFSHFPIDRLYRELNQVGFQQVDIKFETYQEHSPFEPHFLSYLINTAKWTADNTNELVQPDLEKWIERHLKPNGDCSTYFLENYLLAELS